MNLRLKSFHIHQESLRSFGLIRFENIYQFKKQLSK